MLPMFSIVTPTLNQGCFIEETIRSVIAQDYHNLEHIVIDGGSGDNTVTILHSYSDHIQWVSEPDDGQSDAINKGLRLANGDILAYLNSDDTYLPGALNRVAEAFEANPEVGLVYGDCIAVDIDGKECGVIKGHPFNLQRMIMRGEFIPQQAAFWRRQAMEYVGLFDTSLHFCMDHDFFIRLGKAFPAQYIPHPLAAFRFHGDSKSVSQEDKHWRESLIVSQRYGMHPFAAWYWIRRLRHWGLRALPTSLTQRIRKNWLRRPHDPILYASE